MNEQLHLAQEGSHLKFLDGLRGFAVSYVLLYHFMPKTLSLLNKGFIYKIWDAFWSMGWSGVDLFFVLSGFLITGILYKTKNNKNYFKNFYLRRVFRIAPVYYSLIIIMLYYGQSVSAFYWLFLSNFDVELSISFNLFLCVAWSLSIEEQYYMIYPTLVYFFNERQWIRFLVFMILLSISVRFLGHYFEFFVHRQMYHNTLAHFDGIALGGLLRLLLFNFSKYEKLLRNYVRILPVLFVVVIIFDFYCSTMVLKATVDGNTSITPWLVSFYPLMYLYGYTLNSLIFGGIIVWCILRKGWVIKLFSNPVLRNIGKYSYAMYLFQFPANLLFRHIIDVTGCNLPAPVYGICVFMFCYIISRLSWLIIESPCEKLKESMVKNAKFQ